MKIKGKQYYFDADGAMVYGNQEVNNYICKFNPKTGVLISRKKDRRPIYTGHGWHDIVIGEMVKKAGLKSNMSDEQIAKKTYLYLTKKFRYSRDVYGTKLKAYHKSPTDEAIAQMEDTVKNMSGIRIDDTYVTGDVLVTETHWDPELGEVTSTHTEKFLMIEGIWLNHIGVCDDFSAIFTLMLNRMGVKAGKCGGTSWGNNHAWSWAYIDGVKYYFDPGNSIHMYTDNKKKVSYSLFMMTPEDLKKHHKLTHEW